MVGSTRCDCPILERIIFGLYENTGPKYSALPYVYGTDVGPQLATHSLAENRSLTMQQSFVNIRNRDTHCRRTVLRLGRKGYNNTLYESPKALAFAFHPVFQRILCNSLPKRCPHLTVLQRTSLKNAKPPS